MKTDNKQVVQSDESQTTEQMVDKSRRSFAKVGAIAPVVLTLVSRPVLGGGGGGGVCFTPSRSLSRNTSLSQNGKDGFCNGKSPGYWKNTTTWPIPKNTLFHPLFAMGPYVGNTYKNSDGSSKTLIQVLNLGGTGDPQMVAFHIIGAYLNVLQGLVSDKALTEQGVKDIWAEYAIDGSYEVVAGVTWNGEDIKNYLVENFIAP